MKRIAVVLFALVCTTLHAQLPVPPLWGHRVHDEAHILSTSAADQLEAMLKEHEDSTSNQIAVLIITSLEGDPLEDYAIRVANEWKLGRKGKDNGILLLIAVDDRKMRIEVGKGLEGVVPDVVASRIIRNEIAPAFRDRDYDRGVTNGITALIRAIGGEYIADESQPASDGDFMTWQERLFVGLFVFGILGIFTFIGVLQSGSMGWFMYAFLIPFYASFPLVIFGVAGGLVALAIYLVGFPILRRVLRNTNLARRLSSASGRSGRGGRGSSWSSGSGWSSGWSSGSSSSSGSSFSGGGGSFGGGGASGSW
jgi:uncharacterized protein